MRVCVRVCAAALCLLLKQGVCARCCTADGNVQGARRIETDISLLVGVSPEKITTHTCVIIISSIFYLISRSTVFEQTYLVLGNCDVCMGDIVR